MIAKLEHNQKSLGVITQNIDGLHSDAGSQHVDELHGTLNRFIVMHVINLIQSLMSLIEI